MACSTHGRYIHTEFWWEELSGGEYLINVEVDGRKII
jgi:hypothetical protein